MWMVSRYVLHYLVMGWKSVVCLFVGASSLWPREL
jgi:hypothetical protein